MTRILFLLALLGVFAWWSLSLSGSHVEPTLTAYDIIGDSSGTVIFGGAAPEPIGNISPTEPKWCTFKRVPPITDDDIVCQQ